MAITFIQYDDFYSTAEATTVFNDSSLSTTTGNFIVVGIGSYDSTADACIVTGVSDTAGNTYTKAVARYGSGNTYSRAEIWYSENITGNANNIVTATFTGGVLRRYISVSEFSGVKTTNPLLDTAESSPYLVTYFDSGNATSTSNGDLIIGMMNGQNNRDKTLGDGFTTLSSDLIATQNLCEYDILGAAGDYNADCTLNGGDAGEMLAAIFAIESIDTNTQINIGDAWKEIEGVQINIGDTWKAVEGMQVNIGDSWKTIF